MADDLQRISSVLGIPFSELIDTSDFEHIETIGSGTFSDVSLERSPTLGEVAVKEYRLGIKDLRDASLSEMKEQFELRRKSFQREFKLYKETSHSQIPKFHGVGAFSRERGKYLEFQPKLIMEFIDGKTISEKIKNGGLSPTEIRRLFEDILNPLEEVHYGNSKPRFHRDIKPANAKTNSQGLVYLLDFGSIRDELLKTNRGSLAVGTLGYVHPEQFAGNPSFRTDLYSLGATLYAASIGQELEGYDKLSPELLEQTNIDSQMKEIVSILYDLDLRGPQNIKELRDYIERPIEVREEIEDEEEDTVKCEVVRVDEYKDIPELNALTTIDTESEIEKAEKLRLSEISEIERKIRDYRAGSRLSLAVAVSVGASAIITSFGTGLLYDFSAVGLSLWASAMGINYLGGKNNQRKEETKLEIAITKVETIKRIRRDLYDARINYESDIFKKLENVSLPLVNIFATHFLLSGDYTLAGIYFSGALLGGYCSKKGFRTYKNKIKDLEQKLQQTIDAEILEEKKVIEASEGYHNLTSENTAMVEWSSAMEESRELLLKDLGPIARLAHYIGDKVYSTWHNRRDQKVKLRAEKREELFALVEDNPERKEELELILQDYEIPLKPKSRLRRYIDGKRGKRDFYSEYKKLIKEHYNITDVDDLELSDVKEMVAEVEMLRILAGANVKQSYNTLYDKIVRRKKERMSSACIWGNIRSINKRISEIREIEEYTGITFILADEIKQVKDACKTRYYQYIERNLPENDVLDSKFTELWESNFDMDIWNEFMNLTEEWCISLGMDKNDIPTNRIRKDYLIHPSKHYLGHQLREYRTTVLSKDLDFKSVAKKVGYYRNFAKERGVRWSEEFEEQENEIMRIAAAKSDRIIVLNGELEQYRN